MSTFSLRPRIAAFVAGMALLAFSGGATADPPSRVARLGYTSGEVSFSPAGEDDWVRAAINRPLGNGDRLWSAARARAEIEVGGAVIRMDAATGVSVLSLDDRIAQLQLTQGILNVRVRRLERDQVFEVDTPNLAFVLRQPGEYRIEVDPDRDETTILMRRGEGAVYGENASYTIDPRQPYRFTGNDLRERRGFDPPGLDEFDRWANDRDRRFDSSPSARYVSPDVIGYQDLDANGSWRTDPNYGNVWVPSRVEAGWAPYRDGHWAWIDPWGWTWVDDAPWGFAVSHYGRWANLRGTWAWVPGPVRSPAYYAPALVVFVGGADFQLTISSGRVAGVAWFPLAPREVYRPSYTVSRDYFERVNQSNTVINNTVINNVYNNVEVTNIVNVNRQVAGAVVAVPAATFVQSQPVSRTAVRVTQETMVSRPVAVAPALAPTAKSVRGAAVESGKPPPRVFERSVVARNEPPAAPVSFAAQQAQLTAKPGKPLDDGERKVLKPVAIVPAPVVRVLAPTPEVRPPAAAAAPASAAPTAATAATAPPTATAPPAAPVDDRDRSAARAKDEPGAKGKGRPDDEAASRPAPRSVSPPARAAPRPAERAEVVPPPPAAASAPEAAVRPAPAARPAKRGPAEPVPRAASRPEDSRRAASEPAAGRPERGPGKPDDKERKPRD